MDETGADETADATPAAAAATGADDDGVYPHSGKLYCRSDYMRLFGPKCAACQEIIDVEYVTVLGAQWHPHHFLCRGLCSRALNQATSYHTLSPAQKEALFQTILP